jgi:thioesterase domain-containing protein
MAIDAPKTADNLTKAGMPEAHARAFAESLRQVQEDGQWVTRP